MENAFKIFQNSTFRIASEFMEGYRNVRNNSQIYQIKPKYK